MKRVLFVLFIVAFGFTVSSQTTEKKWGVGIGAGAYNLFEDDNKDIGFMPELYLGRYLSPRFDLMLQGNLGLWRPAVAKDLDITDVGLNLRLKLYNESKKFRPYLYAGPGLLFDNGSEGINFNAGLGAKYYVAPATAFYAKAGYISPIEVGNQTDQFLQATLGLEFDFGKSKSKDSDGDGISDKKDNCPNTPAGVAVDENGCPKDSDGDGVADDMDDCPTEAGITSLKGCPDTDKDGVADKNDACPDVAGEKNLKGCPDADGDGVADKDDKCPNTKRGVKVDASGCPSDQDKDGVPDSEDDCPTVAGTKENKGCPAKAKEEITADQVELQNINVPSIHFVSGKSYITEYSARLLDNLVATLNQNRDYNVNIYGYADSQGSDQTNILLSEERVNSTVKYLQDKGIAANRIIQQKAFGEAKPVASNDTAEGRLLNRRVEFEIFKMK